MRVEDTDDLVTMTFVYVLYIAPMHLEIVRRILRHISDYGKRFVSEHEPTHFQVGSPQHLQARHERRRKR